MTKDVCLTLIPKRLSVVHLTRVSLQKWSSANTPTQSIHIQQTNFSIWKEFETTSIHQHNQFITYIKINFQLEKSWEIFNKNKNHLVLQIFLFYIDLTILLLLLRSSWQRFIIISSKFDLFKGHLQNKS